MIIIYDYFFDLKKKMRGPEGDPKRGPEGGVHDLSTPLDLPDG